MFLYNNRVSADAILFAGRCATIVLTLLLGILLFLWTRWRAGNAAGLIAVVLFAFDPNIIAHGRYATNDLAVAAFSFAAIVAFERALSGGRFHFYVLAGLALGAAMATKLSALFVLPVLAVLALVRCKDLRALSYGTAACAAAALAVMLTVSHGDTTLYTDGISATFAHEQGGQLSYLFGMESTQGWWWYFPAAFVLKSPLGLLVLVMLAAVLLTRHVRELGELMVLIVPISVYGTLCLFDRADIGIRYLLPIYPFLFSLTAIACARYAPRALTIACLVAIVIESTAVFPSYLAFFNVLVGGPGSGPRYLLDSNIDWGQDAKRLATWLANHGTHDACISYFGTVPVEYYGIRQIAYPPRQAVVAAGKAPKCYTAISANYLYGDRILGSTNNRWLRSRPPLAKVGYSIYVYDLGR